MAFKGPFQMSFDNIISSKRVKEFDPWATIGIWFDMKFYGWREIPANNAIYKIGSSSYSYFRP